MLAMGADEDHWAAGLAGSGERVRRYRTRSSSRCQVPQVSPVRAVVCVAQDGPLRGPLGRPAAVVAPDEQYACPHGVGRVEDELFGFGLERQAVERWAAESPPGTR